MSPSKEPESQALPETGHWNLRLYVAGQTSKSVAAFVNLKRFCETHMKGQYEIEIVDLAATPGLAKRDQIVAVPTVVKRLPPPMRRIIGDLSNDQRVLVGLDLSFARVTVSGDAK